MLGESREQKPDLQEQLKQAKSELDGAHAEQVKFYNATFSESQVPMEIDRKQQKSESSRPTHTHQMAQTTKVEGGLKRLITTVHTLRWATMTRTERKPRQRKRKRRRHRRRQVRTEQGQHGRRRAQVLAARGRKTLKNSGDSSSHKHQRSSPSEEVPVAAAPSETRMDTDEKQYMLYMMRCAKSPDLLSDPNYVSTLEHILAKYRMQLSKLTAAIQNQDTEVFEAVLEKNPEPVATNGSEP